MAYQLVIFDWDGTVMDSTGRIIACMHQAGADLCLPVLEDDAVREIIGLGLPEALRTLYPGIGDRDLERMRERYAVHFVAAEASPSRLHPGARETLAALRAAGLRLAVATGKSRKGLDRVWASSGLGDSFDASRCADETHSKPHPAMVTELLTELGVAPERALVVGDTSFDLQMARDSGE
ncbi:MAG TPA: HAD family hydrolase, partial [Alcanivorax sp.]|nr:HAD family hydrolase [Alcanivorax sp.]